MSCPTRRSVALITESAFGACQAPARGGPQEAFEMREDPFG